MSVRYREIPPVYCGTSTRMQTLPAKNVSSLDSHRDLRPQPLFPCDKRISPENMVQNQPQPPVSRKCVYHYEDKYTFARILPSDTLLFDSHFESGNLLSAYRVLGAASEGYDRRKQQYDLYMHNDIHTRGNTQWFYFSVSNIKAGQEITFVVRNFSKSDSMYNQGLRPLMLSTTSKQKDNGWVRVGTNIQYFECPPHLASESGGITYPVKAPSAPSNASKDKDTGGTDSNNSGTEENGASTSGSSKSTVKKKKKKDSKTSGGGGGSSSGSGGGGNGAGNGTAYSVSFTHTFERTGDTCYFAFSHPYTYTDLQHYLHSMSLRSVVRGATILRRSVLCRSLAGNVCDLLTITAPCESAEVLMSRPAIIITARVHPGETVASWMMQGVLEYLMADTREAHMLRQKFVFKIVPMLNPDGVINGNYRTNLSGNDLNRRWHAPEPSLHPTIYHTKEMIRRVKQSRPVAMVLDLHGHSRKQGIFTYGCTPDKRHMRPASPQSVMLLTREQQQQQQSLTQNQHVSFGSGSSGGGGMSASNSRTTLTLSRSPTSATDASGTAIGTGTGKTLHATISNTFLLSSSTSSQDIRQVAEIATEVDTGASSGAGHWRHGGALATDDEQHQEHQEQDEAVFVFAEGVGAERRQQESRSVSPSASNAQLDATLGIARPGSREAGPVGPGSRAYTVPPSPGGGAEIGINSDRTQDRVEDILKLSLTLAGDGEDIEGKSYIDNEDGCSSPSKRVEYPLLSTAISVPTLSVSEYAPPVPPGAPGLGASGVCTSTSTGMGTVADGEFMQQLGRSASGTLLQQPSGAVGLNNSSNSNNNTGGSSISGMSPSSSAANLALLQNMLSGNATVVTVKEELPPVSTIREGIPPSKRDILAWKARLLPRVLEVYSPIFTLDNCTFKMHKSKAATMRMVTFVELGIDNVYTIECSLGGKYPNHFSAQDLIQFGHEVCNSLLECHPAFVASSGAPVPSVALVRGELPVLLYAKRSGDTQQQQQQQQLQQPVPGADIAAIAGAGVLTSGNANSTDSHNNNSSSNSNNNNNNTIGSNSISGGTSTSRSNNNSSFYPGQFQREIAYWAQQYDTFSSGFGAGLLNSQGQRDLICTVVEDGDSDDDKEYKDQGGSSGEGLFVDPTTPVGNNGPSSMPSAREGKSRGESIRRATQLNAGIPRPAKTTAAARRKASTLNMSQGIVGIGTGTGTVGVVELNMDLSIGSSSSSRGAPPIATVGSHSNNNNYNFNTQVLTSQTPREMASRGSSSSSSSGGGGGRHGLQHPTGPDEEYFQSLLMGSRGGAAPILNSNAVSDPSASASASSRKRGSGTSAINSDVVVNSIGNSTNNPYNGAGSTAAAAPGGGGGRTAFGSVAGSNTTSTTSLQGMGLGESPSEAAMRGRSGTGTGSGSGGGSSLSNSRTARDNREVIYIPNSTTIANGGVGITGNSGNNIVNASPSSSSSSSASAMMMMIGNPNNTNNTSSNSNNSSGNNAIGFDPIAALKKTPIKKPAGKDPLISDETKEGIDSRDREAKGNKSTKKKGKKDKESGGSGSVTPREQQHQSEGARDLDATAAEAQKEQEKSGLSGISGSGRPKKAKMKGSEGTRRAHKEKGTTVATAAGAATTPTRRVKVTGMLGEGAGAGAGAGALLVVDGSDSDYDSAGGRGAVSGATTPTPTPTKGAILGTAMRRSAGLGVPGTSTSGSSGSGTGTTGTPQKVVLGAALEYDSDSDGGPGAGAGTGGGTRATGQSPSQLLSPTKIRRATAMSVAATNSVTGSSIQNAAFHNSSYVGGMSPVATSLNRPGQVQVQGSLTIVSAAGGGGGANGVSAPAAATAAQHVRYPMPMPSAVTSAASYGHTAPVSVPVSVEAESSSVAGQSARFVLDVTTGGTGTYGSSSSGGSTGAGVPPLVFPQQEFQSPYQQSAGVVVGSPVLSVRGQASLSPRQPDTMAVAGSSGPSRAIRGEFAIRDEIQSHGPRQQAQQAQQAQQPSSGVTYNSSLDALANAQIPPAPVVIVMPASMSISGSNSGGGSSSRGGSSAEAMSSLKNKIANRGAPTTTATATSTPVRSIGGSSSSSGAGVGASVGASVSKIPGSMSGTASVDTLPYYVGSPDPLVQRDCAAGSFSGGCNSNSSSGGSARQIEILQQSLQQSGRTPVVTVAGVTSAVGSGMSSGSGSGFAVPGGGATLGSFNRMTSATTAIATATTATTATTDDAPLIKIPSMSVQVQVRGKGGSIIVSDSSGLNDPLAHAHAVASAAAISTASSSWSSRPANTTSMANSSGTGTGTGVSGYGYRSQQSQQGQGTSGQIQGQQAQLFQFPGSEVLASSPSYHQSKIQGLLLTPNHNFHHPTNQQNQGQNMDQSLCQGQGQPSGSGKHQVTAAGTSGSLQYFNHHQHRTGL